MNNFRPYQEDSYDDQVQVLWPDSSTTVHVVVDHSIRVTHRGLPLDISLKDSPLKVRSLD